jgi:hypothetical protein
MVRTILRLAAASAVASIWICGPTAEPILTRSAIPFAFGAGSVKLDYAGGVGRSGGNSQIVPEAMMEVGLQSGLEVLLRFPLLRVTRRDSSVVGGGQLAAGARYLLTGGWGHTYAVSVQTVVEAPTGDTQLVGDATQVMPSILAEWRPAHQLAIHSNFTFDRSIGGTRKAEFLEYANAVVWRGTNHLFPVFELVGSTNGFTGQTQLVAVPEMILRAGPHLEVKAALQLGLTAVTPAVGLRFELARMWGKPK